MSLARWSAGECHDLGELGPMEGLPPLLSNPELRGFLLGFLAVNESHLCAFRRRSGYRTNAYGSGGGSSLSVLHPYWQS